MGEIFEAVKDQMVEDQREYNRAQRVAWRSSRRWFLAVPVVIGIGVVLALLGDGALDTIGGVVIGAGVLLLFVALWKHVDAGGDDFGAATGSMSN
jgi:hypothetical protein